MDEAKAAKIESKEAKEFKFNFTFTNDNEQIETENAQTEEEEGSEKEHVDFYNESLHFVAPFFIVDTSCYRSMSLKLSLEQLISNCEDPGTIAVSLIGRRNNKRILQQLTANIILNKRIALESIS